MSANDFNARILKRCGDRILTKEQIVGIIQLMSKNAPYNALVNRYEVGQSASTVFLIDKSTVAKVLPLEDYFRVVSAVHTSTQHSHNIDLHHSRMKEEFGCEVMDEAFLIYIQEFCLECRGARKGASSKPSVKQPVQLEPVPEILRSSEFAKLMSKLSLAGAAPSAASQRRPVASTNPFLNADEIARETRKPSLPSPLKPQPANTNPFLNEDGSLIREETRKSSLRDHSKQPVVNTNPFLNEDGSLNKEKTRKSSRSSARENPFLDEKVPVSKSVKRGPMPSPFFKEDGSWKTLDEIKRDYEAEKRRQKAIRTNPFLKPDGSAKSREQLLVELDEERSARAERRANPYLNADGSLKSKAQLGEELEILLDHLDESGGEQPSTNPFLNADGSAKSNTQLLAELEADRYHWLQKPNYPFDEEVRVNDHPFYSEQSAKDFAARLLGLKSPYVMSEAQIKLVLAAHVRGAMSPGLDAEFEVKREGSSLFLVFKRSNSKVLPLEAYYEYVFQVHYMLGHSLDTQAHHRYMYKQHQIRLIDEVYRIFIKDFCWQCRNRAQALADLKAATASRVSSSSSHPDSAGSNDPTLVAPPAPRRRRRGPDMEQLARRRARVAYLLGESPEQKLYCARISEFKDELHIFTRRQLEKVIDALEAGTADDRIVKKYRLLSSDGVRILMSNKTDTHIVPVDEYYAYVVYAHTNLQHSRDIKEHKLWLMEHQDLHLVNEAFEIYIEEFCPLCRPSPSRVLVDTPSSLSNESGSKSGAAANFDSLI